MMSNTIPIYIPEKRNTAWRISSGAYYQSLWTDKKVIVAGVWLWLRYQYIGKTPLGNRYLKHNTSLASKVYCKLLLKLITSQ